jgi:hypothetical protein
MYDIIVVNDVFNVWSYQRFCCSSVEWYNYLLFVCLMVFNATFNNISVISWRSVLLVEETGGPG